MPGTNLGAKNVATNKSYVFVQFTIKSTKINYGKLTRECMVQWVCEMPSLFKWEWSRDVKKVAIRICGRRVFYAWVQKVHRL